MEVDPPKGEPLGFCRAAEAVGHGPIRAVTGGLVVPKARPSRLVFLACMPASVTSKETGARAPFGQQRYTFYVRAFPAQPPTYSTVKVLSEGSTTANAQSSMGGLKPLKRIKRDR